ncbi:MAG TPA: hypothetical protein VFO82_12595 [Steroidobacteraceae bacterium]|nr:hypothetical protein [Steroidobacteraceae bacterium]
MCCWLRRAFMLWMTCMLTPALHAGEQKILIDLDNPNLRWEIYRSRGDTCVLKGTAVSEMRDDAFEVQFRRSLGQEIRLFVLIPGLPRSGIVFIEAPTTRDRWKISTDNYVPALSGERAEALRRNVAAGIPIEFTFEYGRNARTRYETAPRGSILAAAQFMGCLDQVAQEARQKHG